MRGDHLYPTDQYTGISSSSTDQDTGPEEGRDLEGVRGRPQHFYFSNKNRIFKSKLPVACGSTEISDEGAGFMETRPVFTQRHLLPRPTFLPLALPVPTVLELSASAVDDRGQHPKPRHQRGETNSPDVVKRCWGGAHLSRLPFPRGNGNPPAPTPIPQRSPTRLPFSGSTTHYIFCQPQTGPKLHIVATKPRARAHRAELEGN